MRVVSGIYGGRKLLTVPDNCVRPTADIVKEALFSILMNRIYGAHFLDLFAGSGAVGIEALSRGAEQVYFVDHSKMSLDAVKKNLEHLKIEDGVALLQTDYLGALRDFSMRGKKFDVIFIDPPYCQGIAQIAMQQIEMLQILSKNGLAIVEHNVKDPMEESYGNLSLMKKKKYGIRYLSFYSNRLSE